MRRSLAVAMALVVAVSAGPGLARAADAIGVSRDGVTWAPTLDGPLFDPALRWVPGATHTETIWVRNQAADPAHLAVDVIAEDVSGLLGSGMITISASADNVTWRSATAAGTSRLVSNTLLAPGAAVEVAVSVALGADAPDATQTTEFRLTVLPTLTEIADTTPGGGPIATPPPQPANRGIPFTGGALVPYTAALGGALLVAGALAAQTTRRRRDA